MDTGSRVETGPPRQLAAPVASRGASGISDTTTLEPYQYSSCPPWPRLVGPTRGLSRPGARHLAVRDMPRAQGTAAGRC